MATELISLGILFLCAIIGGAIASRLRQPAVFGLLLVGALIGPNALNIVKDMSMIQIMAEFGAILILFIIGLEFDITKLVKLGVRSILIGLLKFLVVTFFGYQTMLLLGFSAGVALFTGVILSFSSTIVVIKVLEQKEMFARKEVPLLIAVLIIEDVIAVFTLTFFSGLSGASTGMVATFERIVFSITVLVFAYFIAMKLLKHAVAIFMRENADDSFFTFLSLGVGALFSYFASYLGLTPSAGAFLAGSLIASLPNAKEYGRAIHPYAMIFTSIFFISMGTLVDFNVIQQNGFLIIALLAAVLISRFLAIGTLTFFLANFRKEQPFFASIAMISVGEFSLLVAKESQKFDIGIDLVTISAALIFVSALVMSFGLNYTSSIHSKFNSRVSSRSMSRFEGISNYMRTFFDQMEIENFFTKKLRAESQVTFLLVIVALFSSIVLRRMLNFLNNGNPIALYSFYAFTVVIISYLGFLVFRKIKSIHYTMAVILTNVDSSRNIRKCTKILNNLMLSLFFMFLAMITPFFIFMLNLSLWVNLLPFAFLIVSYYFARNMFNLIDSSFSNFNHSRTAVPF